MRDAKGLYVECVQRFISNAKELTDGKHVWSMKHCCGGSAHIAKTRGCQKTEGQGTRCGKILSCKVEVYEEQKSIASAISEMMDIQQTCLYTRCRSLYVMMSAR